MESLSSESKSLALDILYDIQSAIDRLQKRTERIHDVDNFLGSSEGMILLDDLYAFDCYWREFEEPR